MLGTEDNITKFLEIIHTEEDVRGEVKALFQKYTTSKARWEAFDQYFTQQLRTVQHSNKFFQLFIHDKIFMIFLL